MTEDTLAAADGRTSRRRATSGRLRAAALGLFAERGYSATSVDDIARRARVSRGSLFYNFGSKRGLGRAVVVEAAERVAATARQAREGRSGWSALDAVVGAVLREFDADPATCRVLVGELFRAERPWHDDLPAARAAVLAPITEVVAEVAAERPGAHHPRPESHHDHIAMAILGAVVFCALDRMTYAPDGGLDDLHDALMATVRGLLDPDDSVV